MRTWLKVLLWVLGVLLVLGIVSAFVLFGPPRVADMVAEPEFCARCHVMKPELTAYRQSAHSRLESCNDCHLPNTGFVRHWVADAYVGARDVIEFNTNNIPAHITTTPLSEKWLRENCVRCHAQGADEAAPQVGDVHGRGQLCWHCHRSLYHDMELRDDPQQRRAIREEGE